MESMLNSTKILERWNITTVRKQHAILQETVTIPHSDPWALGQIHAIWGCQGRYNRQTMLESRIQGSNSFMHRAKQQGPNRSIWLAAPAAHPSPWLHSFSP